MQSQRENMRSVSPQRVSVDTQKREAFLESAYASPASKYTITGDGSKWQYFGAINNLVTASRAWNRVDQGQCHETVMSADPHLADCILLDRMYPLNPKLTNVWSKLSLTHRLDDSRVHWDSVNNTNCRLRVRDSLRPKRTCGRCKTVTDDVASPTPAADLPSYSRRSRRASEPCLSRCHYYPHTAQTFTKTPAPSSQPSILTVGRASVPALPLPLVPTARGIPQPISVRTLPPLTYIPTPLAPLPAGLVRVINYFSECKQLTNKTTMAKHISAHARKTLGRNCPAYMPETFVITHRADDETALFAAQLDTDALTGAHSVWICKGDARAKGDGIVISSDRARLLDAVKSGRWVVQRYVDNPMTVRGRKFDIRVWVLVTPWRCAYVCSESVLRLTSVQYQPFKEDDADVFAHLTNHCIQTQHADYGTLQTGNEMFLAEFASYLAETGSSYSLQRFYKQLNEVVKGSLNAVAPLLFARPSASSLGHVQRRHPGLLDALAERYSRAVGTKISASDLTDGGAGAGSLSFQLLGFDVMLTDAGEMQLLEVNATPAAAEAMLPRVARDATAIVLAPFECGDILPRYVATESTQRRGEAKQQPAPFDWRIRGGAAVPGASIGNVFYPLPL